MRDVIKKLELELEVLRNENQLLKQKYLQQSSKMDKAHDLENGDHGNLESTDFEAIIRPKLDQMISFGNNLFANNSEVDYALIAQTLCSVSEADFVLLNLMQRESQNMETCELAPAQDFDMETWPTIKTLLLNQWWHKLKVGHSEKERTKILHIQNKDELLQHFPHKQHIDRLVQLFDFGSVYLVPLLNGEIMIGHIALFFQKYRELQFADLIEIIGSQIAIYLTKYEMHQTFKQRERKFRILIENSSDVTALINEKGYFTYVSPNITPLFGWKTEELINRSFCDFAKYDDDFNDCNNLLEWIQKNGEKANAQFLFQAKKGAAVLVRLSATSMLDDPYIKGILINFSDISKLLKAEEYSHKLRMAIENNPISVVITNAEGIIEYANPIFLKITGYTMNEITGRQMSLFQSGLTPNEVYNDLWSSILNGKVWRGELQNKKKNGELFWESISIHSIKNSKGKITHFVAAKQDITRDREMAAELEKQNSKLIEADHEKDKFFSIIAHDLRGPFNAFLGLTEFMHEELPTMNVADAQKMAGDLNRTAHNIYELLNNLLIWSRIKMGTMSFEPQKVCLLQLVNSSIAFVADAFMQKGINMNVTIDGQLEVIADVNMITSVVHNLTSNALKFTPMGGLIKISAKEIEGGLVQVEINDSGIGMEPKIRDNLFKLDVKINRPGTNNEPSAGLGLLLCKEFLLKHGGNIWATSQEGKGSTFIFTLYKAK